MLIDRLLNGIAARLSPAPAIRLWVLVFLVLVAFPPLFDWRDAEIGTMPVPAGACVGTAPARPLGTRFHYDAACARAAVEAIPVGARPIYAATVLSLDLAYPALYATTLLALMLAARGVIDRTLRRAAWIVLLAAAADVGENLLLATMSLAPGAVDAIGDLAGATTALKWSLLGGSLVAVAWLARRHLFALTVRLVLVRVPLLSTAVLLVLVWLGDADSAVLTIKNMMHVGSWSGMVGASFTVTLTAALVVFCALHVWRRAVDRFDCPPLHGDVHAPDATQTPRPLLHDSLYVTLSVLLALPLLFQLRGDSDFDVGLLLARAIGVVVAALLLMAISALRRRLRNAANSLPEHTKSRVGRWLGPGYFDRHPPHDLLSGHGLGLSVAVALLALFALGYLALDPTHHSGGLPTIAYVLFLVALVCSLLTGLGFFFDRMRLPLVLIIAGYLAVLGSVPEKLRWWDTNHYFDIFSTGATDPVDGTAPAAGPPSIGAAIDARARRAASSGPVPPVITVIGASGGGIQASAWTARVLAGLQAAVGSFSDSVYLISSTSGGSVGTYFFLESFRGIGPPDPPTLARVPAAAAASGLEALAWGTVFPDLVRGVAPFLVFKQGGWADFGLSAQDRAWAIEQAWLRHRNCMLTPADCDSPVSRDRLTHLSDWQRLARKGVLPGVVFNATFVEDGQQFLVSNLDLGPLRPPVEAFASGTWTRGGFDPDASAHYPKLFDTAAGARFDLTAVTAARLSATFPYVTPQARARIRCITESRAPARARSDCPYGDRPPPAWHIADGGFLDNSGTLAIVRWLLPALAHIDGAQAGHPLANARILYIQIDAFPPDDPRPPRGASGWAQALLGPLQALFNVYSSTQGSRNDVELALLGKLLASDGSSRGAALARRLDAIEFRLPREIPHGTVTADGVDCATFGRMPSPPLSWELSHADRDRIECAWAAKQVQVRQVCRYLGGSRPGACAAP